MIIPALVLVLAAAGRQAPPLPEQLVIDAVVTDKKGHPVPDLKADEIEVQENGQPRPTIRAERDTRPLRVALVLDTSSAMAGNFASDVIPATLQFLRKLPAGAVFSIWATGDHPKKIVDEGTDLKATEVKLRTF